MQGWGPAMTMHVHGEKLIWVRDPRPGPLPAAARAPSAQAGGVWAPGLAGLLLKPLQGRALLPHLCRGSALFPATSSLSPAEQD